MVIEWKCWEHVRSTPLPVASLTNKSEQLKLNAGKIAQAASSSSSARPFPLPTDIVWMIASEVSNSNGQRWRRGFTAIKDITQFRLVCREFNVAGKTMLIKALRDGRENDDRVLRLPPRSGSLSDLKAVLCDGGFASVITDVKILFHPIFQNEHLEEDIHEVLQSKSSEDSEDSGFPWADIFSTLSFNTARIRHQCQQQEEWYRDVYSPTGMEQLRAVFAAIKSVELQYDNDEHRTVHFEQLDYWWGNTEELRTHGLHRKFKSCSHPILGNFMLRAMTDLSPDQVVFNDIDLPRFEGLPDPVSLAGSSMERLPMNLLNDFDSSNLRFPASTSGASGNIVNFWAARQFASFLSCAPNIVWLTLDLDAPGRIMQDKVWLNSIFALTIFPHLSFLRVSWAQFDVEHLMNFLASHKCLETIQLGCFRVGTPDDLLSLIRLILLPSRRKEAQVTLKADLQELSPIMNELRALIEDRKHSGRGHIENHDNTARSHGLFWWLSCGHYPFSS